MRPIRLIFLLFSLCLCACGTMVPPLVESRTPSFDGKVQDSGVISLVPGGQLVTPHWRDRYNGMIAVYGKRFTPPVQTDDGIVPSGPGNTSSQYFIDNEHAVKFDQMNEWRKAAAGVPAAATKITPAPTAATKSAS